MFYSTFSTKRLYHAIEIGNVSHRAGEEHKYHAIKQQKNTINNTIISSLQPGLYGNDLLTTVRLPSVGDPAKSDSKNTGR